MIHHDRMARTRRARTRLTAALGTVVALSAAHSDNSPSLHSRAGADAPRPHMRRASPDFGGSIPLTASRCFGIRIRH
jgi:hypothetical protein